MFSFVADESLLSQTEAAVCLFAGALSGIIVQTFIGFIVDRFKGFLFVYRLFFALQVLGGVLLLIGIENSFPITVIAVSFTGASFHGVMAISLDFAAEVGYPAGPGHASGYLMAVSCLFGGFAATFMSSSVRIA